jgi:putative flippase GtrA
MNRRFTFKVTKKKSIGEGSRFIVVNVLALLINLLLMRILVRGFAVIPEIAQVAAIAGSYCANFIGNKFWTFRENTT